MEGSRWGGQECGGSWWRGGSESGGDERSESERRARRDALRSFLSSHPSLSRSLYDARLSPSWPSSPSASFPLVLINPSFPPIPHLLHLRFTRNYHLLSSTLHHLSYPLHPPAPSLLSSSSTAPPPSVPLLCQLCSSTSCCLSSSFSHWTCSSVLENRLLSESFS